MTDAEVPGRAPSVCAQCGTQIAPALLACPSCRLLVYAEELKRLAATADGAEQAGDPSAALAAWRQALDLLPADERLAPGGQGGARVARRSTCCRRTPPSTKSFLPGSPR